jgi:CheY-like chemotaxis protein
VNAIIDLSNSAELPGGELLYWQQMLKVRPTNQKTTVFVANDKLILTAIKLFYDINKRYRDVVDIVETIQEATTLLEAHGTAGKTILVIEDEDALRDEIIELLQFEGYLVIEASNGLSGINLAQQYLPHLVISDVSMPHMNGFQVVEELRKRPTTAHIPIVLLTARTDRSFMRHGMELGADDYLTKPFSNNELLSAVKSRLKRIHTIKKD